MTSNGQGRLRFGNYELDCESGKLLREGWPVKLQPQPFRVLALLLERPGEVFSREEIRNRIWGGTTFVEFDQGLNYCVRQIRLALRDNVATPAYIETLPKQGYRFVADVEIVPNGEPPPLIEREPIAPAMTPLAAPPRRGSVWLLAGAASIGAAIALASFLWVRAHRPVRLEYTQLTDFTDSAVAPALSSDGRMLAFIRGTGFFTSPGPIYVKLLPNGEPRRVADDPHDKYGLAFSPDGSEIAYTVLMESPEWATYTVSVFGGEPHLFLRNAAGLTWLDRNQLLFSQTKSGYHLGVVTGTATRGSFRELYFPAHERGMAHYSYASPDRKSALVVEMNGDGNFASCRLISLDGRAPGRLVGPSGACLSAGWSPDGRWMYFTVYVEHRSHLWRQRFPDGAPEQLTFGPTEENGVAIDPDGRSLITSVGVHESAIWIHDPHGERSLESEGEVMLWPPPSFNRAGTVLYYVLRRANGGGPELWRMNIQSGASEAVTPGIAVSAFDISPDEKEVVYSTVGANGRSQLWLAPVDRSSPPQRFGRGGEISPYFGPRGQILFLRAEGKSNYLEQSKRDGSNCSRVVPYPVGSLKGISSGRHWITGVKLNPHRNLLDSVLIPVDGGPATILCDHVCETRWSTKGDWLFVEGVFADTSEGGRSLAIPVGPGEHLPALPPEGIKTNEAVSDIPGAISVSRGDLVRGSDLNHFAYVKTAVHSNLYRITFR